MLFHVTLSNNTAGEVPHCLLSSCQPIVQSEVSRHVRSRPVDAQDCSQDAWEAAIVASRTFQASHRVPFTAWVRTNIRWALQQKARAEDPLPESARRDLKALATAQQPPGGHQVPPASPVTAARARSVTLWERRSSLPGAGDGEAQDVPQDIFPCPVEHLLSVERRLALRDALKALPERQRTVVQMRYLHDKSVTEVAAHLGVSPGRVSQLEKSALQALSLAMAGWADDV